MRNFIIIAAFLFSCLCLSQDKEDKLDSIITATKLNLDSKKIVDVFCISRSCWETVAREIVEEKTGETLKTELFELNNFTAYFFWKDNSKIYLQKFDNLNKFKPIELEDFGLFEMIKENSSKIKTEKVLEYEIRIGFKKAILGSSNSCQTKLYFYNEKDFFTKEFNQDHLVKTQYSNGKNINLNYKSNNRLKMIQLFNICDSKIQEAKDNKQFHNIEPL